MTATGDFAPDAGFDAARFLRAARSATRSRTPRTGRFVDAYTMVLVAAAVAAWVWGIVSGLGAHAGSLVEASSPGGPLHREPAPWLGPGFPLLGTSVLVLAAWVGLERLLLVLGPVGIPPDRAFWVWRLPRAGTREPLRVLRRTAVLTGGGTALVGGCAAVAGWWAGVLSPAGPWVGVTTLAVCGAALGVGAVGVAARVQAARAGVSGVAVLPGWELRRAGARGRYLADAVRLGSPADAWASLTGTDERAVRSPAVPVPAWVRGPRRVVLFAALAAQARTRWWSRAAVDLGLAVVLVTAFSPAVILAAWTALLFVAYRGLGRGVTYVASARAGNAAERHLPLSGAAAAVVHLVVPCALNALVLAGVTLVVGLAVQGPVLPSVAVGLVAGAGIGAAAAHRVGGPDPDLTRPPVESPLGPIPIEQLMAWGRGLVPVALLAAGPGAVVAFPHLWPGVLAAVTALTVAAAGAAVRTGERI